MYDILSLKLCQANLFFSHCITINQMIGNYTALHFTLKANPENPGGIIVNATKGQTSGVAYLNGRAVSPEFTCNRL